MRVLRRGRHSAVQMRAGFDALPKVLLAGLVAIAAAGCAVRTITSTPAGARIYNGASQDRMVKTEGVTPATSPQVAYWPTYCFRVSKAGYYDSEVRCLQDSFAAQSLHFELVTADKGRPYVKAPPASRHARTSQRRRKRPKRAVDSTSTKPAQHEQTREADSELFSLAAASLRGKRSLAAFRDAVSALDGMHSVAGLQMNYGDYLRLLGQARGKVNTLLQPEQNLPRAATEAMQASLFAYEQALDIWNWRRANLPRALRGGGQPVPYTAHDRQVKQWLGECPDAMRESPADVEGTEPKGTWVPNVALECYWRMAGRDLDRARRLVVAVD